MKERIKVIGEKIISESFPVLKGKNVRFLVLWLRFYAFSAWIPPACRFIVISTRTRNFSDEIMTGILAHELCHQERYLEMGIRNYLKFAWGFITSKRIQAEEEKATDRLTVEKGYGRHLYQLTLISHKDENHKKIIDNYLSPMEIKAYAQATGKW